MKQERERKRPPPRTPLTLKTTPRAWPPVPPYIDLNVLASWMCVSGLRSASAYDSAFRPRTRPDHPRKKTSLFKNLLILINLIVKTQIRAKSANFRAKKLVLTQRGLLALIFFKREVRANGVFLNILLFACRLDLQNAVRK